MNEYKAMWQNYANFNDRTNLRGYWMAVLINVAVSFGISIIAGILKMSFLSSLYAVAVLVPGIALSIRRLNDIGKPWTYILINLIPVVGWIIFIVILCKPSIEHNGVPTV